MSSPPRQPSGTAETRGAPAAVTMAHVAALAGVSTSTASLAFRQGGPITDRTRTKVLAAADELGYAGPHPAASFLKSGRTGIVGVVVAESIQAAFASPVTVATMDGLSEELDVLGCSQLLLPGRVAHQDAGDGEDHLARSPHTLPVDAVVFLTRGEEFDALLPGLRRRRTPMVGVEGPHRDGVVVVAVDDARGMHELAHQLASWGHRRTGVVMRTTRMGADTPPGPPEPITRDLGGIANRTIRDRLTAVAEVFPDAVRVEAGGRGMEAGRAAAHRLLDADTATTAIMAQNDVLAAGVLRAAADRGIRVPHDLSVTGFDGVTLPWLEQQLTTVEQPLRERGRAAGRLVGELLAGGSPAGVLLPVTVRIGETTGPPRQPR